MPAPRLLAFDFDGVIADSIAECVLIAWLGAHPPPPRVPVSSCLHQVPEAFRRRFTALRGYAQTLEHFLVAHHPAAASITSRAEFEDLFTTIPPPEAEGFAKAAAAARQRCRTEEPTFWAGLHTLYPGIAPALIGATGLVTIITAKDEASVRDILARHRLTATISEVIGNCGDKAAAIRTLCACNWIIPQQVTFVDDNLDNATAAAAAGAAAYWALWGYHAPEDVAAASRSDISRLELAELPALTTTPAPLGTIIPGLPRP